jgi:hypothetical protein
MAPITQYTTPVGEYTTMASFNGALNLTNGFLKNLTSFNVVNEGDTVNASPFITYTTQDTFSKTNFFDIVTQLKSTLQQFSDTQSVVSSHENFNNYSIAIMKAICKWRYSIILNGMKANATSLPADIKPVVAYLTSIGENVLVDINELCMKSVQKLVDNSSQNNFVLSTFFEGGADLSATKESVRYKLRDDMLRSFVLKLDNTPDTNVLIQLKHILLDLYIISMYPLIHYIYITSLLNRYKKQGEFRFMREAVFARATCVIFTLTSLYDKSQSLTDGTAEFDGNLTTVSNTISTVYTYIQKLINIQFGNDKYDWTNVINEVSKISLNVSSKSLTIQQLKEQVQKVQLQIRTDIDTYKMANGSYDTKIIIYRFMIVVTIFFVIICGALLITDVNTLYFVYGVSVLLGILLFIKIIETISTLLK